MKNPRVSKKELNLIKGALRRLFSRSDLRREAVAASRVEGHKDEARPRVTKWSKCPECKKMTPTYLMEVDHIDPLIPLGKSLEDFTWDQVIDRLWCSPNNLKAICKTCHKEKSKLESKERRNLKKGKK